MWSVAWFLTLGNGARLLIPVAAMAPDVRALIRRKALEAGVVVEERAQQDDAPAGRGSATGNKRLLVRTALNAGGSQPPS